MDPLRKLRCSGAEKRGECCVCTGSPQIGFVLYFDALHFQVCGSTFFTTTVKQTVPTTSITVVTTKAQ